MSHAVAPPDKCDSTGMRPDLPGFNGVLITPDDLNGARDSLRSSKSSVYVKPLDARQNEQPHSVAQCELEPVHLVGKMSQVVQTTRLPSDDTADENPCDPNSTTLKLLDHSLFRVNETDFRRRAADSPSALRINKCSFSRNAAVRRSIGGTTVPTDWPAETYTDPLSSVHGSSGLSQSSGLPQHCSSSSDYDASSVLPLRVSKIPSLDDLGFALDSYSHPKTGQFTGLRLLNRFKSRQVYFKTREGCPFEPNDVIVMVNQHRLSKMHESQAIRYVCNAFRDAQQYSVEFGIIRSAHDVGHHIPDEPPMFYEITTLPGRNGQNKRFSDLCFPALDPSGVLDRHRPLREPRHPTSGRSPQCVDSRGNRSELTPTPTHASSNENTASSMNANSSSDRVPFRRLSSVPDGASDVSVGISDDSGTGCVQQAPLSISPTDSPVRHRRSLSSHTVKSLNVYNTRTIGRKISIALNKLVTGGLGFTLTSRDTHVRTQPDEPVYVKTILATGAAIKDGRLLVGDRLLSVNGVEVKHLEQALAQLRLVRAGESVNLVVSRQAQAEMDDESGRRSIRATKSSDPDCFSFRSFTFEFPLSSNVSLQSTPPNLGVNFRWVAKSSSSEDSQFEIPGLYVHSVLPSGLVAEVGRQTLLPDDRLVGINGQSLDGLNAKVISQLIKRVLTGDTAPSSSKSLLTANHKTFYLTVDRRVKSTNRNSFAVDQSPQGDVKGDADPASVDSASDVKHRRHSTRRSSLEKRLSGRHSRGYSNASDVFEEGDGHGSDFSRHSSVPPHLIGQSYFDREGFGRRSMSEKRHGHRNPAQLSFYQTHILPNRYRMPEDVDKQYSTMPSSRRLKLHKERMSAAAALTAGGPVKALHPLNSDSNRTDDPTCGRQVDTSSHRDEKSQNQSAFRRGVKQNSSFRNAVDRSLTLNSPRKDSIKIPTTSCDPQESDVSSLPDKTHPIPPRRGILDQAASLLFNPRSSSPLPMKRSGDPMEQLSHSKSHFDKIKHLAPSVSGSTESHTQTNSTQSLKPNKKSLGSFRGLFKRTEKKAVRPEIPNPSSPTVLSHEVRRLSAPGNLAPDALHFATSLSFDRLQASSQISGQESSINAFSSHCDANDVSYSQFNLSRPHTRAQVATRHSNPFTPANQDDRTSGIARRMTGQLDAPPPVPPRVMPTDTIKLLNPKSVKRPDWGNSDESHTSVPTFSNLRIPNEHVKKSGFSSQSRSHSPIYVPKQSPRTSSARSQTKADVLLVPPKKSDLSRPKRRIKTAQVTEEEMSRLYANKDFEFTKYRLSESQQPTANANKQTSNASSHTLMSSKRAQPSNPSIQVPISRTVNTAVSPETIVRQGVAPSHTNLQSRSKALYLGPHPGSSSKMANAKTPSISVPFNCSPKFQSATHVKADKSKKPPPRGRL